MNIDPSPEEIRGSEFIVKIVNKKLSNGPNPLRWKEKDTLVIKDSKDITQRDQFGLSLKVKVRNKRTKEERYCFLKLPPGPEATKKNQAEKTAREHYGIMRKRFEDEFEKHPIFQHIIDRCKDEDAMFSIARPLALCVVEMDFDGNSKIELPGLLYDYIDGDDLSKKNTLSHYPKTADSFFNFAKGLTRAVQLIHNNGVLHSFLVPRNIIQSKDKKKYTIVGFGYSSFCDSRHHAPPLKVSDTDRCYRAPECAKMENLGALWLPVDIYSVGAILYQLAIGEIPNKGDSQLPRDVNRLKEHIYDKLSDRVNDYENPSNIFTDNENILKILDRCLRFNPEDRFSCAEELIEALEIAKQATGVSEKPKRGKNRSRPKNIHIHEILVDIASKDEGKRPDKQFDANSDESGHVASKPANLNHLFDSLLKGWSDKAVEDADRMQRGHHEIYGHRDVLVTSLCRLLAGAKEGNIYRTMTLPSYWTDNNLGSNGRFLTMNKHMARKGLIIERIFLVNKPFHELTEREQEILEFQLEAERIVKKYLESKNRKSLNLYSKTRKNSNSKKGDFKVMVKEIKNEKELTDFETNGTLVAYLESSEKPDEKNPDPKNCLCLNFVSHGHYEWLNGRKMIEHSIKKVRYWIPKNGFREEAFSTSLKAFANKWQNAISLEEYIGNKTATTLEELLSKGKKFTAK